MRRVCCEFYTRILQFVNRIPGARNLYSRIYRRKSSRLFSTTQASKQEKPPFLNSITVSYHVTRACVHARSFQSCPTLCDPMDCSPPGSSVHGSFPGKNTRKGCQALLQGIFSTQGSPTAPALQADSLLLSHQGSPSCHTCTHKKLHLCTVHFLQGQMAQFYV